MPTNDQPVIHRLPTMEMRVQLADMFGVLSNLMKICEMFVMGSVAREEMLVTLHPEMREAMTKVLDSSTGVTFISGISDAVTMLLESVEKAWAFAIFDGSAFMLPESERPRGEWVADKNTGEMVFVEQSPRFD